MWLLYLGESVSISGCVGCNIWVCVGNNWVFGGQYLGVLKAISGCVVAISGYVGAISGCVVAMSGCIGGNIRVW